MKIIKKIKINDGEASCLYNNNYMLIEELPRTEMLLTKLFNAGWVVHGHSPIYLPAINQANAYSFYRHGSEYLFIKECNSQEDDDFDLILNEFLSELELHDN